MNEERERVRCRNCELVQWRERELCRRCGVALPEPIVKIVERVVERIVFQPSCESAAELQTTLPLTETGATTDFSDDGRDGAVDDPGGLPKVEPQTTLGSAAARHREDNDVSQTAGAEERSFVRVLS